MNGPLVSVVIPCHNAARWLPETLASALGQTWPHQEIILVDDGSTDDSLSVARSYECRGVTILTQSNRGAAAARNAGLRAARGDFLQFLDADDVLAPDKIERQLARLRAPEHRQALASGAWARFTGDHRQVPIRPFPNARDLSGAEFLQLHYETGCMMHPAAWLAPRMLVERIGPWDETLSLNDDGEYFARMALASTGILHCPEARSYYRSRLPTSLSRRTDPPALDSLFRSIAATTGHLLRCDHSDRTRAAVAHAWKRAAFELYPDAPELARAALDRSRRLGGSRRPFPGSGRFQFLARILGWRLARRLTR